MKPPLDLDLHEGEHHAAERRIERPVPRHDLPAPPGDPRGDAFTEDHVLLGSRDLFRTTLGLHHQINETWGVELMYEHLSHGQVLGKGRNQGLDNIGVRVSYSFR